MTDTTTPPLVTRRTVTHTRTTKGHSSTDEFSNRTETSFYLEGDWPVTTTTPDQRIATASAYKVTSTTYDGAAPRTPHYDWIGLETGIDGGTEMRLPVYDTSASAEQLFRAAQDAWIAQNSTPSAAAA